MSIPWFENQLLKHYSTMLKHQLSKSKQLCRSFQHHMCVGATNTKGTYTCQRTSTLNTMFTLPQTNCKSNQNQIWTSKTWKDDLGHSRSPNTTNPSTTTGPCQLSDTVARLKGVLEKRFGKGMCVAEWCPRSTSTKQRLIMVNPNQSHQINSCNLKQVYKEFQRTTCHL